MPREKLPTALSLLLRRNPVEQVHAFFKSVDETFRAAFADAERAWPADREDRPGVHARGSSRRALLDRAFRISARKAKLPVTTKRTSPATWSYPVVQIGPYSITLAIGDRSMTGSPLRLRCKGKYMQNHAENNEVMDPQTRIDAEDKGTRRLIPNGSIGAVIIAEPSMLTPDTPNYIGFYIPTEDLSSKYYTLRIDRVVSRLGTYAAEAAPRKSVATKRTKPALRRGSKQKRDGERS